MIRRLGYVLFLILILTAGCAAIQSASKPVHLSEKEIAVAQKLPADATPLDKALSGIIEQTTKTRLYDPSYVKLEYPNGDVPEDRGVCADVVVRAFRKADIDLQKELHEDMKANFSKYPRNWGASKPDKNIDHRRVPNLMTWFDRRKKSLPATGRAADYQPGDIVAWELDSGRYHIGVVSKIKVENADRYAVVHNIGIGARLEDVLFQWKIIGHYRYF